MNEAVAIYRDMNCSVLAGKQKYKVNEPGRSSPRAYCESRSTPHRKNGDANRDGYGDLPLMLKYRQCHQSRGGNPHHSVPTMAREGRMGDRQ